MCKKIDYARVRATAATMAAAEHVRCACGDYGDWDHSVSGTSGPAQKPCVWAGCPNCRGSALGVPVGADDLRYARKHGLDGVLAEERVYADVRRIIAAARPDLDIVSVRKHCDHIYLAGSSDGARVYVDIQARRITGYGS